jgi:hypothetical protein
LTVKDGRPESDVNSVYPAFARRSVDRDAQYVCVCVLAAECCPSEFYKRTLESLA